MYVVFGIFLAKRTEGFIIFLVLGQVPFSWFARSVNNASRSLIDGRGLISQLAIPKVFFPMLVVTQDLVKQGVVFVATLGFILLVGQEITWTWLALIPIIVVQFIFVIAVGMMLAAIVPIVPDFKFLIATILTIMMWGSGIFYSYEEVLLPKHQELFLMNPTANLIKNYRDVVLNNQLPDWGALAIIAGLSLLLCIVMLWTFRRNETLYARLVIQ